LDEIKKFVKIEDVCFVVIGNKCDSYLKVNFLDAKKFSDSINSPIFEVSVKKNENLDFIATLVDKILKKKKIS